LQKKYLSAQLERLIAVFEAYLGAAETTATVKASDLGLSTKAKSARDLWRHTSVAFRDGVYTVSVHSHGVLML
jgi:hypothetical protein